MSERVFVIYTKASFVPYAFESKEDAREWAVISDLQEQMDSGWEVVAHSAAEAESMPLMGTPDLEVLRRAKEETIATALAFLPGLTPAD